MISLSRRSSVLALIVSLAGAALLVSGVSTDKFRSFGGSAQAPQPHVTNRTTSLQVSGVRKLSTGDIEVRVSNRSEKTIFAYTIVTGQRGARKGFTTYATAEPLAPGQTKAETISSRNLDSEPARPGGEIVLSAVYLEGGSVEGDASDTGKLKETMQGMKEQARVVLDLLRNAMASSDRDMGLLMEKLEAELASTPQQNGSVRASRDRDQGKAMVNDRLLKTVKKLQPRENGGNVDVKPQLAELITYYQRLTEKL
jgi:hypothetical protein